MKINLFLALASVMLMAVPTAAHAQLDFQFTQSTSVSSPGGIVTFSGTLTNSGSSEVFLNGYTTSPIDPNLTLDDTKFFNNVPLSLASGDSWSGELFDIDIAPTTLPADYSTDFTILGGADGSTQDALATQSFTVNVPTPAAVPEASTAVSLGIGLLPLLALAVRRHRKRGQVG